MMRIPSLTRAMALLALVCLFVCSVCLAADPAPATEPAPPPSLIGLSRADVVGLRGKPSGERKRGDVLVMVYADGTKIELRGGQVVAVSGGGAAGEIVGADGTRYVPGEDGNIQRPVQVTEPEGLAEQAPEVVTAPVGAVAPAASPVPQKEATAVADKDLPPGAEQAVPGGIPSGELEDRVEEMSHPQEAEPASLAKTILVFGLDALFRLGFTVLVLRLTLHFVGVPFFWPDLLKVSLLYLAVREVMHGLGGLGGWWEFVPLFKLDDVVSFAILACSLTWFKIAGSGLTALKIAAATGAVVMGLMLAVGLALTFGLSAMR